MENVCHKYVLQITKVKETIGTLEAELYAIKRQLQQNPTHSGLLKDLKKTTLDMTITLNELEHCQSKLEECQSMQSKTEQEYND